VVECRVPAVVQPRQLTAPRGSAHPAYLLQAVSDSPHALQQCVHVNDMACCRLAADTCNYVPIPSLQGRADYHGPDVNLAARLMGAAAPGQVVTSIETAQHIFR
jgi:hypothetical protein